MAKEENQDSGHYIELKNKEWSKLHFITCKRCD